MGILGNIWHKITKKEEINKIQEVKSMPIKNKKNKCIYCKTTISSGLMCPLCSYKENKAGKIE
jgi:hypothetical protein